jgi:hypothetical protein
VEAVFRILPRVASRVGHEELGQHDNRVHVELHHGQLRRQCRVFELAEGTVPGVVDQGAQDHAARLDVGVQLRGTIVGFKIGTHDGDDHLELLLQIIGQGLHPGHATGRQHELVAVLGKVIGQRLADTRRCAGDECCFVGC